MRPLLVVCALLATASASAALNVRQDSAAPQPSNPPSSPENSQPPANNDPQPSASAPPPPPNQEPSKPPTQPSGEPSKPPVDQPSQPPPPTPSPSQPNDPAKPSNNPSQPTPPPQEPAASPPPMVPSVSHSIDANGGTVEVTVTVPISAPSGAQASPSQSTKPKPESTGLSTGSIVGMSVAGGVALIGIAGFFAWKLTRKRFSDFDDNEAIKWPELNAHGESSENFALPPNQASRAGFVSESDVNLSRTASASTGYAADPYAVPPLPHTNPNQPYRDDPGSAYYDPYRGPIPHTFSDATAPHDTDAIPMSSIRARSPGPGVAYDTGRASPVPSMGRQSPGPHMAYANRSMSPGPNTAYGGYPH